MVSLKTNRITAVIAPKKVITVVRLTPQISKIQKKEKTTVPKILKVSEIAFMAVILYRSSL